MRLARGIPRAVLWVVRVPSEPPAEALARSPLLSENECHRADAFRVPGRRQRFVLGRVLLKNLLASVLGREPADIDLELGHNNRPRLSPSMAEAAERRFGLPLDFNLSSTPGRIACGMALGARIGVDVEAPAALEDLQELARTVLAPEEITWMNAQQEPLQAFYRLWTLKESAAKAHGEGLGLPFPELRMQPDEAGGLIANFDVLESHAERWSVLGLEASGPAALAVHWNAGNPGEIDLAPSLPPDAGLESIPVETTARL